MKQRLAWGIGHARGRDHRVRQKNSQEKREKVRDRGSSKELRAEKDTADGAAGGVGRSGGGASVGGASPPGATSPPAIRKGLLSTDQLPA